MAGLWCGRTRCVLGCWLERVIRYLPPLIHRIRSAWLQPSWTMSDSAVGFDCNHQSLEACSSVFRAKQLFLVFSSSYLLLVVRPGAPNVASFLLDARSSVRSFLLTSPIQREARRTNSGRSVCAQIARLPCSGLFTGH